ncbi:hypothetical protein GZH53_15345 [Flavihumibacter sp. R14]|nr:hypothetical protein [Flavihumibacter soli]
MKPDTSIKNRSNLEKNGNQVKVRSYSKIIKENLSRLISQGTLADKLIQESIPRTDTEFLEYYSYNTPQKSKSFNKAFGKLDILIGQKAASNTLDIFRLYLELATLVDGEYAEGWSEDADFIIGKQKEQFCKIYSHLTPKAKQYHSDLYSQYCR